MSENLEKRVREIVAEKLKVDPARVTREANFIDDLGADSLDATDLFLTLEKETGKSIVEADAGSLKTFGDLMDYLAKDEAAPAPVKGVFLSRFFAGFRRKAGAK